MERRFGCSVADHLHFAQVTGRRIVGVTDHDYYLRGESAKNPEKTYPYEFSLGGLEQFRDEVRSAAREFPELAVFFSIELGARRDLSAVPDALLDACDFLICEAAPLAKEPSTTDAHRLRQVEQVRDLMDRAGKPAFIAHPFRLVIDDRLILRDIDPSLASMQGRPELDFEEEELNSFFRQDVRAMARACRRYGVAVEVNGHSCWRMWGLNIPALYDLLCAANRVLRDEGVDLVPGSDQHEFRLTWGGMFANAGVPVPWQVFDRLGLSVEDSAVVRTLLSSS
jgi:histidinol phosphatase-like PHP family hydrolase